MTTPADSPPLGDATATGFAPAGAYFLFAPSGPQGIALPPPTNGDDDIQGDGDPDTVDALAGDDTVRGGGGNDVLHGGADDDALYGEDDDDELHGDAGADILDGGAGSDTLLGGAGDDQLIGGIGIDTADYSAVTTALTMTGGNTITGAAIGTDTLNTVERILGGSGNDTLRARGTHVDGGLGTDTLVLDRASSWNDEDGFAASLNNGLVTYNVNATTGLAITIAGFENILGSSFDDDLVGDGDGNFISGGNGDDELRGLGGIDTVSYAYAGSGATVDLLTSGPPTNPRGEGSAGAGDTDVLFEFENVLGSAHGDDITGEDGANRLDGAGGDDALDGEGGDDVLVGGAGDDTIVGGGGLDTAVFAGNRAAYTITVAPDQQVTVTGPDGTDTLRGIDRLEFDDQIVDFVAVPVLHAGLETAETIYGGDANDRLYGRGGDDLIEALEGNDDGNAGAGNDIARMGAGNDRMYGSYGDDGLFGGDGSDRLIGDVGADSLEGGDGNDFLYGGSSNDGLSGGDGHDFIDGAGGDDLIVGGRGNDRLQGRGGADEYAFESDIGADRIFGFENDVDVLHFFTPTATIQDLQDVLDNSHVIGGNIIIFLAPGEQVSLIGFAAAGFTVNDLADDILMF